MATTTEDPLAGEWNGFVFKRTSPEQFDIIQDLVYNHFYPDEPITNKIGFGVTEDFDLDAQDMWRDLLGGPLSFGVYEKNTEKLVAIRLTGIAKPEDPHPEVRSESIKKVLQVFEILYKEADVYNRYDVNEYVSFILTTVHKDFRGKGIATEIYRRSIALCRQLGHKLIVCNFSSPFSLKGALNNGFEKVAICDYHEMKDEQGNKFVAGSQPGDVVVLAVYKL